MNRVLNILLFLFVFVGVFADFLANDKPILVKTADGYSIPVFLDKYMPKSDDKILLSPPIKYSQHTIDTQNSGYVSPLAKQNLKAGQQRHFLGTDQLGRDVLAGMIHGTSLALKIGVLSMLLALIIAMLFSVLPSYFGDTSFKISVVNLVFLVFFVFWVLYYLVNFKYFNFLFKGNLSYAIMFFVVMFLPIILGLIIKKMNFKVRVVSLPLDSAFSLFVKIFQSLPGSFLVLVLISMFANRSIYNIIIVIAILKWPLISRYIRAEILKVKSQEFIESSKAIALSNFTIISRHILPHIMTPVFVALSFGFAGTILLESTLSFLGVGIPSGHVSWGILLSEARHNFSAWWLAVFPGMAIFVAILIFRLQVDKLNSNY